MVFAFANAPTDALASLAKQLDKLVADNDSKKLAAVINFPGEANDENKAKIAEFAKKHNIQKVALTVTKDGAKFKVSPDAEVTVMHYKGKEVKFNHAVAPGALNDAEVKKIVEGAKVILAEAPATNETPKKEGPKEDRPKKERETAKK